jgi:hypothetical protein
MIKQGSELTQSLKSYQDKMNGKDLAKVLAKERNEVFKTSQLLTKQFKKG